MIEYAFQKMSLGNEIFSIGKLPCVSFNGNFTFSTHVLWTEADKKEIKMGINGRYTF